MTLLGRGNFFEFNVVAQLALLFGLRGLRLFAVGLLLLRMLVHALLHFAEALFYLAGGAVQRDDELEYQLVQDIC